MRADVEGGEGVCERERTHAVEAGVEDGGGTVGGGGGWVGDGGYCGGHAPGVVVVVMFAGKVVGTSTVLGEWMDEVVS